jgi:hypothetical protein
MRAASYALPDIAATAAAALAGAPCRHVFPTKYSLYNWNSNWTTQWAADRAAQWPANWSTDRAA